MGHHFRSDLVSHRRLAELLGRRVISLELVDKWFYHLDTCLAPLDARTVVLYPPALDAYAQRVLREIFDDWIELDQAEARRFAANAVVVGRTVALGAGCAKLAAELTRRGYDVIELTLDEFIKAGGSAKCLTLFLER